MTSIRVWDLPLRLFHWVLVLAVSGSLITGQFSSDLGLWAADGHKLFGYTVLTLLLFRLAWGFAGSTYSRFSSFLHGPRTVLRYLEELTGRRESQRQIGHNPLGAWSVMAMLLSLAVQAGTGLFLSDEDLGLEGPLSKYVSSATADRLGSLHEANAVLLFCLIGLHLGAIAFYLFAKRENLVKPMITGTKQLPSALESVSGRGGNILIAVALLLSSAGIVWVIANRL